MTLNCSDYVGKRVAWHEVDDCTGLVVGYADFSEMPACLRSVDSPDFDLLILEDGESEFVINNERSSFLTFSSNSFFISVKDRTGCLSINLTICHPNCD